MHLIGKTLAVLLCPLFSLLIPYIILIFSYYCIEIAFNRIQHHNITIAFYCVAVHEGTGIKGLTLTRKSIARRERERERERWKDKDERSEWITMAFITRH
jgi:hypothetical protein